MYIYDIDDLLVEMAKKDIRHFSPYFLCQYIKDCNIEQITDYLLSLVNKNLIVYYEVQCPNEHSDYVVKDPHDIVMEPRECQVCGEDYIPDPSNIWVAFDFMPSFVEHVKKNKSRTYTTLKPRQMIHVR
ncbi:hypothetical protein SDC9_115548 [bioreactor metagenome]|uniref:Uncharacterized protein n=1 Tax=bioreactor metagenome TaxID=1076179 RepID=A0A645C3S9_9ZZZZ